MSQIPTLHLYLACVPEEMEGERAILEGLILPELRQRAGMDIVLVDSSKDGRPWDLARRFQEIDRCHPFFLGFLGERYGDPPVTLPRDLVAAHPWVAEDPGRSDLELEILYAVLQDPARAPASFFYLRDPRFPQQVGDRYRVRFLPESPRSAERLAVLKHRIHESGRPVLGGYSAVWSDTLSRASRLDDFTARLLDDLWGAIEQELQSPSPRRTPAALPPAPPPRPERPAAAPAAPSPAPGGFDPNATMFAPAPSQSLEETRVLEPPPQPPIRPRPAPRPPAAPVKPESGSRWGKRIALLIFLAVLIAFALRFLLS
ncbi:MAG TPA: hypothetical protein VLE27_10525 [Thermoanaerobaculia bacterium]|nr:hypothetical protein [Thermoanaerobaculia bacterium]